MRDKVITIGLILFLSLISFTVCLLAFNNTSSNELRAVETKQDNLSGEKYDTSGLYNYRDANPYGSYFIGFQNISEAGITSGDKAYIEDVLINFAMYHENVFNGKISYVKDSFSRDQSEKDPLYTSYQLKFGINDGNIHTLKVRSSWLNDDIHIQIYNSSNNKVFDRKFRIYTD